MAASVYYEAWHALVRPSQTYPLAHVQLYVSLDGMQPPALLTTLAQGLLAQTGYKSQANGQRLVH